MGRLATTEGSLSAWVDGPRSKRFQRAAATQPQEAGSAGGPARRGRGRGRREFGPTARRSREAMEATPVLDELDELSIMELRDELEEEDHDEDAIDAKCDALRAKLLEKAAADAAA